MGVLNNIKVLDLTHFIAGPFCGQLLADYGAEVIKIEPLEGEFSRKANPMFNDISLYYSSMNRNKKGMALSLKTPEGQKILHRLVEEADVLVTNYGVGVPERLGFGYETISNINPKIVMTHLTGFGLTGPYKNKSAFDGIVQAMSGIVHLTGEPDGEPLKAGLYIADHIAGMQGAIGTLLALNNREQRGKGELVDISMLDSMVSMLAYNFADVELLNHKPQRAGNDSTNVFATTFTTKDGYIYIAPLTQKMWRNLCEVIGHSEWAEGNSPYYSMNGRLENYRKLKEEINKWFMEKSTKQALLTLQEAEIACASVDDIEDVMKNPQLKEREMIMSINLPNHERFHVPGIPIKFGKTKHSSPKPPPYLGEHTKEILSEIGYSEDAISLLFENGIATGPK